MTRFEEGLGAWPLFAAAWSVHGGLLLYVFFSRFPIGKLGPFEATLVPAGLIALVALEAAALAALAAAVETLAPKGAATAAVLDSLKSLGLTLVLTTLVTSTLKFITTSVHLKITDLWFAYTNFRQILQEAQFAEALALLALPAGAALLAFLLWIGFRRLRRRPRRLSLRRFAIAVAAAAVVLAACGGFSVVLPQVLEGVVPEGHWAVLERSHSRFLNVAGAPAAGGGERWIAPYEPGAGRRLNVVLVMLESVPWKRTFASGLARPGVTPNLERLAAESVLFDRAYAVSTHSDYAQMAILSSLHPRKYQRHDYYIDIDYPRTLIWDALDAAGYETSLFSCQNERWGNMLSFLETPGLDVLRHSLSWPDAPRRGSGLESKVYEETPVAEWRRWRLARRRGPYFTYLNFQSNHFPYEVPPGEPRPWRPFEIDFAASFLRYPAAGIPVMLNRFDNALRYADRKIGEVVDFLKETGEWDSTVLVVVSDHGEAFYEHAQPTHGTALYEEQLRSFWMVRAPGLTARRIAQPVTLLDVAPTLLELLGLAPHRNFQGRGDVLSPEYSGVQRPIFSTIQGLTQEDAVLLGDRKLIVSWDRRTKMLFDLASDPDERIDLAGERPGELQELERLLGTFLQQQLAYYRERLWSRGYYPAALP